VSPVGDAGAMRTAVGATGRPGDRATRPGRVPGRGAVVALLVGLALAAAACGSAGPQPTSPPGSAPPGAPATPVTPAPGTPAPGTPATASPIAATSAPGSGLVLDDTLLGVLPEAVGGIAPIAAPESFEEVRNDPSLAANVEAIAFFVLAGPADLASGSVSRLREGVFSAGFWRDWRDTYDAGACAQAGGVTGNAEAELGGRTTYITSCAGGLRVYHVHLAERGVIVSMFSVGPGRFGEAVAAGLRP
jgi:hypothetical protein